MARSQNEIRDMLEKAITARLGSDKWAYIVDIYPDHLVYESADHYYQCSYAIVDDAVTLGDATEVERKVEYEPIKATGLIVAAKEGDVTGFKWAVRVAAFGLDLNGNYWDKTVLTAALSRFEGAKVFALKEAQHQAKPHRYGKSVHDLVGVLSNCTAAADGIYGDLTILPAAAWLRDNLVGCAEMELDNVLGLSVDVSGKLGYKMEGAKKLPMMTAINNVTVDVVYDPVAKGEFLKMAAARQTDQYEEEVPMIKTLLAAFRLRNQPDADRLQAALDNKTMTEPQVIAEMMAAMDKTTPAAASAGSLQAAATGADTLQQMQVLACSMSLRETLAASKLPEPVQDKLRASFTGTVFTDESLQAAVKAEKEMLDKLTASGTVSGAGDIRMGLDSREKINTMLDDFFAGNGVQSFKAAYQDITGDMRISGEMRDAKRMTASITTGTFDQILGDALTRRMLVEYNASGLDDWKKIVERVPLADFRTQHRPRLGGYGDLPAVAQSGAYTALTTPADEESTYAPTKRGGTEDITLEAIRNDDVGIIRRVPTKLARAASRTLYKFVFDMVAANPVIYDSVALFHATHANLGSAALAKAAVQAGRLAMMKQVEAGSSEPLGIGPRFILVPADLEDTAYELLAQPNLAGYVPAAADAVKNQTWDIITVKTWTDANNWFLVADPKDIPTIELGFLDGKEEPELFVQDMPNVGSMFSNDKLTYKIRHIYGGGVMDYRGIYGGIVA